jgi:Bacterial mobilisation protein (MobC)
MPRKRQSATGELKDKTIRVCVTPSEYESIQKRSGLLSMSEYLLRLGLGQPIPQRRSPRPVPQINRLSYLELGNISNNLNQIARACHHALQLGQGCDVDLDSFLPSLLAEIKAIRLAMIGADVDQDDDDD